MIASSDSLHFAPIWGGSLGSVWSVACCTAWYGSTSLQQSSNGSCSLHVSGNNLQADCQRVRWFLRSAAVPMQLPYQWSVTTVGPTVQALMLAVLALK